MPTRRIKIDLDYIRPNNSFIYPLYSEDGRIILDARTVLTSEKIIELKEKYGNLVFYTDNGDRAVIPDFRMKIAYNKSKEIINQITTTDKITKSAFKEAEKVVEEIVSDLSSTEFEAINLLKDLKSYDEYLYNHSVNVGVLTSLFAKKRGIYTQDELKYITLGAYLHDIGSSKIDKQLLNKSGKLNITEVQKMKRHPQLGYEILKNMEKISPIVLQTILFHHEKYNHKGYYGIPYETLPEFPKLASICDIYDALTSKRPFRDAISTPTAIKSLVNAIDTHFDYELISDFINKVAPILNHEQSFYTLKDFCELNTREIAMITEFGVKDYLKPKVIIYCKFMRQENTMRVSYYKQPIQIDLQRDEVRRISKIINNENQIATIRKRLFDNQLL